MHEGFAIDPYSPIARVEVPQRGSSVTFRVRNLAYKLRDIDPQTIDMASSNVSLLSSDGPDSIGKSIGSMLDCEAARFSVSKHDPGTMELRVPFRGADETGQATITLLDVQNPEEKFSEAMPVELRLAIKLQLKDEGTELENSIRQHLLLCREYHCVMSLDYGTTNSTMVVYLQALGSVNFAEGLAAEQRDVLLEWLLRLIEDSRTNEALHKVMSDALTKASTDEQARIHELSPQELRAILLRDDHYQALYQALLKSLSTSLPDGLEPEFLLEYITSLESGLKADCMESQRFYTVDLEQRGKHGEIPSTLQVCDLPKSVRELRSLRQWGQIAGEYLLQTEALMGTEAQRRMTELAYDTNQFVRGIKRHFADASYRISNLTTQAWCEEANGNPPACVEIGGRELHQLSCKWLIDSAVKALRVDERTVSVDGNYPYRLIATTPTGYPGILRTEMRRRLEQLGIEFVDVSLDEAVAGAIYFIWREIGSDPHFGLHSLRARCRLDPDTQDPYEIDLFVDIGGGTTDIALIHLPYKEEIFQDLQREKNAGRYFSIEPRLRGATGKSNFGGDNLTLWVFRILKSRLVETMLRAIRQREGDNLERLPKAISALCAHELLDEANNGSAAANGNGRVDPLSQAEEESASASSASLIGAEPHDALFNHWRQHKKSDEMTRVYQALNESLLDKVVPTCYGNDASRSMFRSVFYALWGEAERIKHVLGTADPETGEWPELANLPAERIREIVTMILQTWDAIDSDVHRDWMQSIDPRQAFTFDIVITQDDFEQVVESDITSVAELAANLVRSSLKQDPVDALGEDSDPNNTEQATFTIDRLILSGQTCNLRIVQRKFPAVFRDKRIAGIDETTLAFNSKHAKTAVAMGAAIAASIRLHEVKPDDPQILNTLKRGHDQFQLRVENLFLYLPYEIRILGVQKQDTIFALNTRFEPTNDGKRYTAVTPVHPRYSITPSIDVLRSDPSNPDGVLIGILNVQKFATEKGYYGPEGWDNFVKNYSVMFEVDYGINLRVLFVDKAGPLLEVEEDVELIEPSMIQPKSNAGLLDTEVVRAQHLAVKVTLQGIHQTDEVLPQNAPLQWRVQWPGSETIQYAVVSQPLPIRSEYTFFFGEGHHVMFRPSKNLRHSPALVICEDNTIKLLVGRPTVRPIYVGEPVLPIQKTDKMDDPFSGIH